MTAPTILIVDDEPAIVDPLEYALQRESFTVLRCGLGQQALDITKENSTISLIVLDIGLPDINGFEVCKRLRETSEVPILFLTARNDEVDRIIGLEIGADDYVAKPFSPREVTARVKVILRRLAPPQAQNKDLQSAPLAIDEKKAKVIFFDQVLELTKYEFLILSLLAKAPERVFSRQHIMASIWPDTLASLERSVDTHMKTLRAKLREVNADCEVIKTHRGLGYSLNRL